jgi:hypothetical protein
MIPGYNSSVVASGVEYHVQTEDLGSRTASVLTLVYQGGAIVARQKTSYRDPVGEEATPEAIKRLIDLQHQDFLRRAAAGEFALSADPAVSPAPPPPAPAPPTPPDAEIDRLIEEYLRRRAAHKTRR